jgi:hypothetical protein
MKQLELNTFFMIKFDNTICREIHHRNIYMPLWSAFNKRYSVVIKNGLANVLLYGNL